MTFWMFLDRALARLPGWPTERQWVTIGLGGLIVLLLGMAHANPGLWDVEVFKVIAQAVVLTGFLNMVLAFHFAANKGDEDKTRNTAAAFEAITATANAAAPAENASKAADEVAGAAEDKADQIRGGRMSRMLSPILADYGDGVAFWCPGCGYQHVVNVRSDARPRWGYNDNPIAPTFTPSVLVQTGRAVDAAFAPKPGDPPEVCHSFVRDGQIQFLADCTHALAGQTVPMPEYPL